MQESTRWACERFLGCRGDSVAAMRALRSQALGNTYGARVNGTLSSEVINRDSQNTAGNPGAHFHHSFVEQPCTQLTHTRGNNVTLLHPVKYSCSSHTFGRCFFRFNALGPTSILTSAPNSSSTSVEFIYSTLSVSGDFPFDTLITKRDRNSLQKREGGACPASAQKQFRCYQTVRSHAIPLVPVPYGSRQTSGQTSASPCWARATCEQGM